MGKACNGLSEFFQRHKRYDRLRKLYTGEIKGLKAEHTYYLKFYGQKQQVKSYSGKNIHF